MELSAGPDAAIPSTMKTPDSLLPFLPSLRTCVACAAMTLVVGFGPCHAQGRPPQGTPQAGAASAPPAEQPNDGSDYIAGWTVLGEICQKKYPQIKAAVDEFWAKRWDQATRERVARMKQTPEFKAKLAVHRKNLGARKDEVLDQCGRTFYGGAH